MPSVVWVEGFWLVEHEEAAVAAVLVERVNVTSGESEVRFGGDVTGTGNGRSAADRKDLAGWAPGVRVDCCGHG